MTKPRPPPRSLSSPRHVRLGELLSEARRRAAFSQFALAQALGQPQSFVSRYESGFRRLDAVELLLVADVLGCDLRAILEAVKQTPP